jgi:hypothetical protein
MQHQPLPLTVTTPTTPTKEGKTMTNPISYQQSTIVDRPADEVWAYVADYAFDLQWRDGLTDMTPTPDGPPQTGTTVHEELSSMGTTMVNDTTITMTGGHAYRFVGDGTSDISLTLNGPIRFAGLILRPILRRNLKKDLQRFRVLVDASAVTAESAHR